MDSKILMTIVSIWILNVSPANAVPIKDYEYGAVCDVVYSKLAEIYDSDSLFDWLNWHKPLPVPLPPDAPANWKKYHADESSETIDFLLLDGKEIQHVFSHHEQLLSTFSKKYQSKSVLLARFGIAPETADNEITLRCEEFYLKLVFNGNHLTSLVMY
jgi:hypothetical protein